MRHSPIMIVVMFGAMMLVPHAAFAAQWTFGAGVSDFDDGEVASATAEVHEPGLWAIGPAEVGLGAAGRVDDTGSAWLGVGLSATADLGSRLLLEASVMPGYYSKGSARTDLGGNLQFRSLLGIGYTLSAATQLSLALDHLSNAGTSNGNPGANTVQLRLQQRF